MIHTTDPQIAAVYRQAAEIIRTNGHCKGDLYRHFGVLTAGASLDRCAVCMVGAICLAAAGDPTATNALSDAAMAFLSPRVDSDIVDEDHMERIADWNDRPERTPDEVVAELLAAADAAEAA